MFSDRVKMRLSLNDSPILTRLVGFFSPFIQWLWGWYKSAVLTCFHSQDTDSLKEPMTINSSERLSVKEPKIVQSDAKSDKYILERNKVESER